MSHLNHITAYKVQTLRPTICVRLDLPIISLPTQSLNKKIKKYQESIEKRGKQLNEKHWGIHLELLKQARSTV